MLGSPREVGKLLAYNRWANARVLETVSALAPDAYARPTGGSFESLHATLVHLYGAEWIWLARSQGESPPALPSPADIPTLDALKERWRAFEGRLEAFAGELTDRQLFGSVRYVNFVGETWTYTLDDILFDLVNHSTYHRGQVATLLRQLGGTPLSTDYSRFLDEAGSLPPTDRTPKDIADLFAYNRWANRRVLEAVEGLSGDDYARPLGGSFATLRDTLTHIHGAEWVWLERYHGRSPRALPETGETTLEGLREKWSLLAAEHRTFVNGLTAADLSRLISYESFQGDPFRKPLGELLVHVANHSTYHRGQVATLLRQLGSTPRATEYLIFLDEGGAAPADATETARAG